MMSFAVNANYFPYPLAILAGLFDRRIAVALVRVD